MRLAKLTAIIAIVVACSLVFAGRRRSGQRMGLRGSVVRVLLQPVMARCSRLPSADESPDLRNERLGIYVANMP